MFNATSHMFSLADRHCRHLDVRMLVAHVKQPDWQRLTRVSRQIYVDVDGADAMLQLAMQLRASTTAPIIVERLATETATASEPLADAFSHNEHGRLLIAVHFSIL